MVLETEEYGPFMKENDTPIYVDTGSNHPPKVLCNIPKGINSRLSTISSSKDIFERAAPVYQAALDRSGYKHKLEFDPNPSNENKKTGRQRKRSIIWFNPPYSRSVVTNVGREFLQIMDKHFPPGNPLHQIFNRNKVKMSYRCTPNLSRQIRRQNSKVLIEFRKKSGASSNGKRMQLQKEE